MGLHAWLEKRTFQCALVAGCFMLLGCGPQTEMVPTERFAIKFVKAHQSDGGFSVASNIAQQAGQDRHNGNRWENETWQAGLSSKKEQYLAALSQYFDIIEAPRQRQVRFTYTDNDGVQEALWSTDLHTKQTVPHNALAKRFTSPKE